MLRRFARDRFAVAGVVMLGVIVAAALVAPLLSPYDPQAVDLALAGQGPSAEHPLGGDELGRDLLTRILVGARLSLLTGFVAVGVALVVGLPAGLVAGYFGGVWDQALMRLMDLLLAFPTLLLAILIVMVLGPSAQSAMVAVGVASVPIFARLVRSATLTVRELAYVEAARGLGQSSREIIRRHVLPNVLSPVIVQSTLRTATAILTAAGLGFLGLGAQPPVAEWGLMLSQGRGHLQNAPHIVLFPSLAILLAVLAFNLVGDGLNDALNPRMRKH
jgi:peptide/nickel transport system permease protein